MNLFNVTIIFEMYDENGRNWCVAVFQDWWSACAFLLTVACIRLTAQWQEVSLSTNALGRICNTPVCCDAKEQQCTNTMETTPSYSVAIHQRTMDSVLVTILEASHHPQHVAFGTCSAWLTRFLCDQIKEIAKERLMSLMSDRDEFRC